MSVKDVEFESTSLATVFVELIKMAAAIYKLPFLFNNQFRQNCTAIYNKRWKEFDTDLYLLSFFLHPKYRGMYLN